MLPSDFHQNQCFHDQSEGKNHIWKQYKNKKKSSPCKKYNLFFSSSSKNENLMKTHGIFLFLFLKRQTQAAVAPI